MMELATTVRGESIPLTGDLKIAGRGGETSING
jgi:hypothetical protein